MNIFYLDDDPRLAAKYLCNVHVVKMLTESAQMLSNCFPAELRAPHTSIYGKNAMYNHPCSKWVRESKANFLWLIRHAIAINNEYWERYGKHIPRVHRAGFVINRCYMHSDELMFPTNEATPVALAMPDEYKIEGNPVQSYRNYYNAEKLGFSVWPEIPPWVSPDYTRIRTEYIETMKKVRETARFQKKLKKDINNIANGEYGLFHK